MFTGCDRRVCFFRPVLALMIVSVSVGMLSSPALARRKRSQPSTAESAQSSPQSAPKPTSALLSGANPLDTMTGSLEPENAPTPPAYSQKNNFSFAVIGDSAPPARDLPVPVSLFLIYDDLAVVRPDILFHTGNAIWAKAGDEDGARLQLRRFRLAADTLPSIPYFVAPGPKDIPDEEADVVFRKEVSGGQPWRSFDYENSHFIVLDTEVPDSSGKIAGSQLQWLQSDLDSHSQAAHTFVFLNRTAYPAGAEGGFATDTDRDAFGALMAKYHVNTVFSGGSATYSEVTQDGVRYVNTGGAGSPTTVGPANGGFEHYTLVNVTGDNVSVMPVEPRRISVRTNFSGPATVTVYNTSATPLLLNNVGVPVPAQWRSKHTGLLQSQMLGLYSVSASSQGASKGDIDVAPVSLQEVKTVETSEPDILFVRLIVPAGSAVTIKAQPAS